MNNTNSPVCAIGLDVGGTKIAAGLIDLADGRVLARRVIPTAPERGGAAVLDDTEQLAVHLLDEALQLGVTVRGIGLGVCELVDTNGAITSAAAVAWAGLPVRERLGRLAPTVVEADVRAAALAEAQYGAGRGSRIFVYVTVGTGISSCLVLDGSPFAGARGNALVFASSPITMTCSHCGTVLQPVLEEFAGGPGLVARYTTTGGHATSGHDVLAAAATGDHAAINVVVSAAQALGVGVGWLVNVLDPERIVVGGGLGSAGGLYWDQVVAATREHIWADSSRGLPIVQAQLGPDAGMIGAAAALIPATR